MSGIQRKNMEYEYKAYLTALKKIPVYKMIKPEFYQCTESKLIMKMPVLSWELNHMGSLHGGVIAMFLDFTCGLLTSYLCHSSKIPTINLNINYLSSAYASDELYVEAIADKIGMNLINLSGKVYVIDMKNRNQETLQKKKIATSTSAFFVLDNSVD